MMLARNADSLFWIGRYVERADDMARILDVSVQQLLEDPTGDTDRMVRHVLSVLGFIPDDTPQSVWTLADRVAYDRTDPASIAGIVYAARENARGAREVISSEMWECLNATYQGLGEAERRARRLGPHAFLSYVKERAAMFAGLADATLSHDDGYSYLLLGRSIERVDMLVRMLLSPSGERNNSPTWMSVLTAVGAQDTYVRAYRGAVNAENVIEFLVLDRLFPRSIFNALRTAEVNLAELDRRPDRVGAQSEAMTLLGRARSGLEFIDPAALIDDLMPKLLELQASCRAVSECIAEEHFHVEPWLSWTDTGLVNNPEEGVFR
ncbi:MAG: alpha-E domain-containing protein [Gordonia sp. (in: high G+C Gram-positive bacteria)]|uniref:alpha-E domain-containing protein n=1 Tax=Gordonia sp. (in: high G+C Gram-positive bacteria) TaxID=84139 RepID=UPI0039E4E670